MSVYSRHYEYIASRILTAQALPDLRGVTVLLPNMHVAQPLAQALMRAAQLPALLLPHMTTLDAWAAEVTLDAPVLPDSRRGALLYQQLKKAQWFEQADLWGMAQELLTLFDELTQALNVLPGDADTFAEAVQQAYQARQSSTLQLEARLVFELWHAMQGGSELDAARAYQQRLARLAAQAQRPLYVLRATEWNALEQRFLDSYAARAPLEIFDPRTLDVQWAGALGEEALPSLSGRLRFFSATSLEQEACAAAMQVRCWLQQGRRNILVVAQDRVVARRVRALLERVQVLVADESGWTYATLSVSTALERWLTALQSDFYHHDLLDLLKSPFIFADLEPGARKALVYALEQMLRKQGVVAGLEAFIALAAQLPLLQTALVRLRQAATLLDMGGRKTLTGWLQALQESLQVLGMEAGLQQDDAGQQLLRALQGWQQELVQDAGRYRYTEWRRWLAQQLDTETYRDCGVDSPVRFTHLAATRWRVCDAVLLLGCDAGHLPSAQAGGRWFNDAVRASLDLPTRATHAARQRDDLLALLAMNDCVLVTWQRERDGEPALLSPFLQIIRDRHTQLHGDDLAEQELSGLLAAEGLYTLDAVPATRTRVRVPPTQVPESISVGAYNSLVACPYQFYARHILRLNELDEVQEGMEKRDYGELVHRILQRFHGRHECIGTNDAAAMEADLRSISVDEFAAVVQQDFAARAWLARWLKLLPKYLEWQVQHEAAGWRHAAAERDFDCALTGIRLRGRIDRLDMAQDGRKVLDYKAQGEQVLRNKLREPGEDVQLACYAQAEGAQEAAFLAIDGERVQEIAPAQDIALLAQLNAERLQQVMAHMRDGSGLPAHGIDAVCAHCEMRGLCRKGEWQ